MSRYKISSVTISLWLRVITGYKTSLHDISPLAAQVGGSSVIFFNYQFFLIHRVIEYHQDFV